KSNEVVFMPLGFSPAFGGFSATTVPDCLVGMRPWQMRSASVVASVGGCLGGSDPRMSLEIDEATTTDDALEVREEFIQETLEDDEPAVLRITFNAMVDVTQFLQANRRLESGPCPCHSSFCLWCT
ncbi:hypothetical protein V1520DRAFT_283059, partial [Lipomyces starkeyi]